MFIYKDRFYLSLLFCSINLFSIFCKSKENFHFVILGSPFCVLFKGFFHYACVLKCYFVYKKTELPRTFERSDKVRVKQTSQQNVINDRFMFFIHF